MVNQSLHGKTEQDQKTFVKKQDQKTIRPQNGGP